MVVYLSKTYPNKFAIAVSTEDVKNQFGKGFISFPMEWKMEVRLTEVLKI